MRRRIVVGLAALALLLLLATVSLVRVPEGSAAWCGGRFLGPGLHLKLPFARVTRYPDSVQTVSVQAPVQSQEGRRYTFALSVSHRWNLDRLRQQPIDPESLDRRLSDLLAESDGRYPTAGLGSELQRALEGLLADLPIDVVAAQASSSEWALEQLRAAARPTGERVVVLGMDGFDWGLLDTLIAQGRCPTFARFKRTGAWGQIQSQPPVLSPLIWTSIATGRSPEDHGVLDFVVKDPKTGLDTPITNQSRKVHAFWNILSYVGRRVDVVNWWASYPAEPINGVQVSERMFYQLFGIRPSLKDPSNVSPSTALPDVLPLLVDAEDIPYEEVRQFADISRADFDAAIEESRLAENPYDNRINHLRKILAVTKGVFAVGQWLLDEHPPDMLALYVEGTDTIGHRFAQFLSPKLDFVSEEDYHRYRETMARYYELCDRQLAELMTHAAPDTTWIVVADHGFYTGAARPGVAPDDFTVGAAQWHRMVGVFLALGPDVKPGRIPRLHIHDLCRTLLWLEGAPISRQLTGTELTSLMRDEWVREHPPVYVDDYDLPRTWIGEGTRSEVDEARLRELTALGYLSSRGSAARPERSAAGERPQIADQPTTPPSDLQAKPTEPYNLGKLAQQRGDYAAAERYYQQAIEAQPNFAIAMASLADVYRVQQRYDEALRYILRALETGSDILPPVTLLDLVRMAEAAGRGERALGALDLLHDRWGETSTFHAARGLALEGLGHTDEAQAEFVAALKMDPADAVATERLLALAAQGRPVGDLDAMLGEHLKAVQHDLKKLNDFGVVCLRQRRPAWAERALKLVLDSDPANAGVLSNMAVALQMQGKIREAAGILERVVATRPNDANLRYNYGAVLAALERNEEALSQLEAAQRLGANGPRVFAARAKVLFRMQRPTEARAVLEEGTRLHPDDDEIRELLSILRQDR